MLKNKLIYFTLILLTQIKLFSQEGKIGINTNNPKSTLHVNGDMIIESIKENKENPKYLLTTNEKGNIEKTKNNNEFINSCILALSNETNYDNTVKIPTYNKNKNSKIITFNKIINAKNNIVEYNDNNSKGEFIFKKTGYYFINVYCSFSQFTNVIPANSIYKLIAKKNNFEICSHINPMIIKMRDMSMMLSFSEYFRSGDILTTEMTHTNGIKTFKSNLTIIPLIEL